MAYAEARALRQANNYTGQDCRLCPGREACVAEWDRRCNLAHNLFRSEAERHLFLSIPSPVAYGGLG